MVDAKTAPVDLPQSSSSGKKETVNFTADVTSLLSHIIYHFYSHREIFLRELISNCSDALDKHRYQALQRGQIIDRSSGELKILITPDAQNNTLTIRDTGLGMTKADMINFLGTIANSGTQKFAQMLQNQDSNEKEGSNLIGQFGIGFYSAFLVADRVEVISKNDHEDHPFKWESDASASYTIEPAVDYPLERGTEVVLHLKEGATEFLKESKLEEIVTKHSSYIEYDIYLTTETTKEVEIEDDEEADKKAEDKPAEDGALEEDKKDEEKKKKTKSVTEKGEKHLNKEQRIWNKQPDTITEEEFNAAYKTITKSWENPFMAKCMHAEAASSFKALIFIHNKPKSDVFESKMEAGSAHVKMYQKGVLVMDFNKKNPIFESYLQSLAMVVLDIDDMPMNISRESLTSDKVKKLYMKYIKNRIFAMLNELKEDKKKWSEFYKNHANSLKLGVHEDSLRGSEVLELLSFDHAADSEEQISMADYVKAMPEKQEQIYFASGKSLEELRANPTVCEIKARGQDCLLFTSPLDEFVTNKTRQYKSKNFQDISKEGFALDAGEDAKSKLEAAVEEYKDFCAKAKTILSGTDINEVKVKNNFVGAFTVQVPDYAMSAQMEMLHKSQPLNQNPMAFFNQSSKVLAINPEHRLIKWIKTNVEADAAIGKEVLKIVANTALLKAGYAVKNATSYADQITQMLELAMGDEQPAAQTGASETPKVNGGENVTPPAASEFDEVD